MGSIAKTKGFGKLISQSDGVSANAAVDKEMLIWNQEEAILDVTELLCELMEERGVTRAELSRKLKKSKGYVSQLLDGTTNMTIRTVSDVMTHLGHRFKAACKGREAVKVKFTVETTITLDEMPTLDDIQFPVQMIPQFAESGSPRVCLAGPSARQIS